MGSYFCRHAIDAASTLRSGQPRALMRSSSGAFVFRIGLHCANVLVMTACGLALTSICSRIASLALPGQSLVSTSAEMNSLALLT